MKVLERQINENFARAREFPQHVTLTPTAAFLLGVAVGMTVVLIAVIILGHVLFQPAPVR